LYREFSKASSSPQDPLCSQITIQSREAGPSRAQPSQSAGYGCALPAPGYTERAGVLEAYHRGSLSNKCVLYVDKEGSWKCYFRQLDTQPWRLTPTSFPLKKAHLVLPASHTTQITREWVLSECVVQFSNTSLVAKVSWGLQHLGQAHTAGHLSQSATMMEGTGGSSPVLSVQAFTSHPGLRCISASDLGGWGKILPQKHTYSMVRIKSHPPGTR